MMKEIQPPVDVEAAAQKIFGEHLPLTERYVWHLSTSGIERGLIGPRESPRLWDRHVLNCAVVSELISTGAHVADVGSGAGLPGLCLALAREDLSLTLIEPLERRVLWLEEVIADLDLGGQVRVLRSRSEQAVSKVTCDVVTARVVSALAKLLQLTIPLLHGSGELLAITGRSAELEIEESAKPLAHHRGQSVEVMTVGEFLPDPTTIVRVTVGG